MIAQSPAREAPLPPPLEDITTDPAFPDVVNRVEPPPEPVLDVQDIQGNILAGFNKDFQTLMLLRIAGRAAFKRWLAAQVPFVATMAQVHAFNRAFKSARAARKVGTSAFKATWLHIAFSHAGLGRLVNLAAQGDFADESFQKGLLQRSQKDRALGDPVGTGKEGDPVNWVVGGPENEADVILILAADDRCDMLEEVERLGESLGQREFQGAARILFTEEGANLPPPLSGHEHFGFLDGVSQPGVRGRVSNNPHDVLTPRQNPEFRDQPPGTTSDGKGKAAQGKPGQDVLWPGEFVLGYPKQDAGKNPAWDGPNPIPDKSAVDHFAPKWARNGSFLVFRRLRQDVFAFHTFLRMQADDQRQSGVPEPKNATLEREVGASLVGRWPSGAPTERAPGEENRRLADDDCANNHFEFRDETEAIPKSQVKPVGDSSCQDEEFGNAAADPDGSKLPFTGHIRKAYPRDDQAEKAGEPPTAPGGSLNESSTQTHRIIRRGIPFGAVSPSTPETPLDDGMNRGLHFLAYQSSIRDQFEFITRRWVNNRDFKEPFNPSTGPVADPIKQGGGHDPVIGQNDQDANRDRTFALAVTDAQGGRRVARVTTGAVRQAIGRNEWVIPTGGGYFFSPSIAALKWLAGVGPRPR
jgi:Dyp-type peroxidase family